MIQSISEVYDMSISELLMLVKGIYRSFTSYFFKGGNIMTFGEKLKSERTAKNLSQAELSAMTGISERSISTYEQTDTLPRRSNLVKLAQALDIPPDSLRYGIDDNLMDAVDQEEFFKEAKEKYGAKGAREAADVLIKAGALFAGGDLTEEGKDAFYRSLTEVFLQSKAIAREKFTPKSRKKK
jgi:transcriptional regulator with XRE-family HTH domain